MQTFTDIHHQSYPARPLGLVQDGAIESHASGKEHPVLRPLKAAILSLDWEISTAIMQRYDTELQTLENLWQKENIRLACLRILRALGKYVTLHLAATPPDAINLVSSVYIALEKVVSTPGMPEAEKITIVQGELKKYNELKKQLASTPRPAKPQRIEPQPQSAEKVVPLDGTTPWRQSVIEDLFRQPQGTSTDGQIAAQHLCVFTPPSTVKKSESTAKIEEHKKPAATSPTHPTNIPITAENIAQKLNTFFDDDADDTSDYAGVVPLSRATSKESSINVVASFEAPNTNPADQISSLFQEKPTQKKNEAVAPLDETAIKNKLDSFFDDDETMEPDNFSGNVVRLAPEVSTRESPCPLLSEDKTNKEKKGAGEPEPTLPPKVLQERIRLMERVEQMAGSCTEEPLPFLAKEVLALTDDMRNHSQLNTYAAHIEQLAATAGIAPILSPALQDDARDIIEKLLSLIAKALARDDEKTDSTDIRSLARAIARHTALVNNLLTRHQDRSNPPPPVAPPTESPDVDENDIMDLTVL